MSLRPPLPLSLLLLLLLLSAVAACVPRVCAQSYKFAELVELLEAHYAALPQTQGGAAYVPVFYWVGGYWETLEHYG